MVYIVRIAMQFFSSGPLLYTPVCIPMSLFKSDGAKHRHFSLSYCVALRLSVLRIGFEFFYCCALIHEIAPGLLIRLSHLILFVLRAHFVRWKKALVRSRKLSVHSLAWQAYSTTTGGQGGGVALSGRHFPLSVYKWHHCCCVYMYVAPFPLCAPTVLRRGWYTYPCSCVHSVQGKTHFDNAHIAAMCAHISVLFKEAFCNRFIYVARAYYAFKIEVSCCVLELWRWR